MKRNKKNKWILLALSGLVFAAGASDAAVTESSVSLKVRARTERNKNQQEEVRETGDGTELTITTDSRTEICTLKIEVKMRDKPTLDCQLEWYFLSEQTKSKKDKGVIVVFDAGKKNLSVKENVLLKETIISEPFVMTTVSSSSGSSDKVSGHEYEGYIVLVTHGGEILARASNSSRYLDDEWIEKCKKVQ